MVSVNKHRLYHHAIGCSEDAPSSEYFLKPSIKQNIKRTSQRTKRASTFFLKMLFVRHSQSEGKAFRERPVVGRNLSSDSDCNAMQWRKQAAHTACTGSKVVISTADSLLLS